MPFASRHVEATRYADENLEGRLQKNIPLRARLSVESFGLWETHPNGLLVPTISIRVLHGVDETADK
jgi:hypothetical protein